MDRDDDIISLLDAIDIINNCTKQLVGHHGKWDYRMTLMHAEEYLVLQYAALDKGDSNEEEGS